MKDLYLKSLLVLLLVSPRGEAQPQVDPKPSSTIEVENVRRDSFISVWMNLKNLSNGRVFIPFGGENEGCFYTSVLAARLESRTAKGWQPAQSVRGRALLGGKPLDRSVELEHGKTISFLYRFDATRYKLSPRQRLRVVVDAWSDEASVKTKPPTERLISPEFKMP